MTKKEYQESSIKGECPQNDILRLEGPKGVRKKNENRKFTKNK